MFGALIYFGLGLLCIFIGLTIKTAIAGPTSMSPDDIEFPMIVMLVFFTIFWPVFLAIGLIAAFIVGLIYASNELGKLLGDALK